MTEKNDMAGLTTARALELLKQYGRNELTPQKKENFIRKVTHVAGEPMFLLLFTAAIIYFFLGEPQDGAVMLIFVFCMAGIDVAQQWKTDRTLNALKELSAPHITVIRDGIRQKVTSPELVPGDVMIICEGDKIPADGVILSCNDYCVDESSLTGESERVWKHAKREQSGEQAIEYWRRDYCYAGTLAVQGNACVLVEKTGPATEYGKIGVYVNRENRELTPLQLQTRQLITVCAGIAMILLVLVSILTYNGLADSPLHDRLIKSILSGITLAMAMIPEEFPVILTVFLAMGAWRLAKKQSLVRRLPSVETLGEVSVLCVDKTGTITANHMEIKELWQFPETDHTLLETMGLACETETYDPMEKAMLEACEESGYPACDLFGGTLLAEYAFTDEAKMMGHVWQLGDRRIIAAKGSPETLLTLCDLSHESKKTVEEKLEEMAGNGLRVIAIARQELLESQPVPESLSLCKLAFTGLAGLADPPRDGIKESVSLCYEAGIRLVMITGDNGKTADAIAKQIGMNRKGRIITGEMMDRMNEEELRETVKTTSIFSRVIPEHKMRIVKALRENGEITAMTGDGVNDAPALTYADIGIAMGQRGSEVSREAADLILLDDNFGTIVETIKDGRRIYDNIRKAIGYIFAIHIPIAGASLLASLLKIPPSNLMFLPVHIVLMELIIDPTCSIVLERQPAESCIMRRPPRKRTEKLLTRGLLLKSIIQGFLLFALSFGSYYLPLCRGESPETARSKGLTVIILGNLFLVMVNSSECDTLFQTLRKLARDKIMCLAAVLTLLLLTISLYSPLHAFLKLSPLSLIQLFTTLLTAVLSVFWYELWKYYRMKRRRRK